jgi:hypothetical protein
MPYPSIPDILGLFITAGCASFFYIHGNEQRSFAWLWPVLSFVIWACLYFIFHAGLLVLFLGQVALFVLITIINMSRKHTANIVK